MHPEHAPGHGWLEDEVGYTLAEVAVALALLLTVLIPLGNVAVLLTARLLAEEEAAALALARRCMEETLAHRAYEDETTWLDDGRWRTERRVRKHGRRVEVVVAVFRRTRPRPAVTLVTVRWRAEDG